ncbi:MAG: hypothetical protein EBQ92_04390 [Proteobacteria bacterium]|nr:hypothetical protein [Pseudomonadota bacterium]
MFPILEKIDKALESKEKHTLMNKAGKHFHGTVTDSWIRISGGKLRGKLQFHSEEKGPIEMDANDILDLLPEKTP